MTPQMKNPNGRAGVGAHASGNSSPDYIAKKFPPFGKKLDELRRAGKVPAKRVIVTTTWSLGAAYPRIVITPDVPVANLRFNYLASLHVQVVHFDRDYPILDSLIAEIRAINPASLALLNVDSVRRSEPAFEMIFSKSIMEAA